MRSASIIAFTSVILSGCTGSETTAPSTFAGADEPAPSGAETKAASPVPAVTDRSYITGSCVPAEGDGAPPLWECGNEDSCVSLAAFDVHGDRCRGTFCPVCVRRGDPKNYLTCPADRVLTYSFSYPGQIWCAIP